MEKKETKVTVDEKLNQAIDSAYEKFVPGLTKFAISALDGRIVQDVVAFGSHVFQRRRAIGFLHALQEEWEAACKEQRVESDYLNTENGQVSLQELFDYLAKDVPNERKFEAMKKIFFFGAECHKSDKTSEATNLLRLCRQIDPEEILILGICYKSYMDGHHRRNVSADTWPGLVSDYSNGLISAGTVDFFEQKMIDHRLIGDRNHSDRSGICNEETARLKHLGIELAACLAG